MINDLYTYEAVVNKIIDGDTIDVTIDLGFKLKWKSHCRFYGINTPELKSKDVDVRLKALEAKQYVMDKLVLGGTILIKSRSLDAFGRALSEIYYGPNFEFHINQELLDLNLAIPFV